MISDTLRHFLSGLQRYTGDLILMFLPKLNTYRRFAPRTFAPPSLTWGFENRTTRFRIVGHDAGSWRVENRLPGADTNPYFTVAAALAVGRPALPKKFEPNEPVFGYGFGKVPENLMFPRSMPEAMAAFHKSNFAR